MCVRILASASWNACPFVGNSNWRRVTSGQGGCLRQRLVAGVPRTFSWVRFCYTVLLSYSCIRANPFSLPL